MSIILSLLFIFFVYYLFIKFIVYIINRFKKFKSEYSSTNSINNNTQLNVNHKNYYNSKINTENSTQQIIDYKNYYRPKRYVISKNELNFYTELLEVAKELDLIVFSQVSLYNILETKPNLDYKTRTIYFNKISSKSIDFVLVDKNDCRIKLCIELDDSSHKRPERIKRDNFINELFKSLEIDLLRYPTYTTYYKDTLKKRIQENIKEHYYEN